MDDFTLQNIDETKISKINSAAIVNISLNNLWIDSFRHLRSGEYLKWNNDLDCIWTILGGEPTIKDSDDEKEFLRIEEEISKSGNLSNSANFKGFSVPDDDYLQKLSSQKAALMKKAMFLRRLQNSQGKGTAYDSGDDEDFE